MNSGVRVSKKLRPHERKDLFAIGRLHGERGGKFITFWDAQMDAMNFNVFFWF